MAVGAAAYLGKGNAAGLKIYAVAPPAPEAGYELGREDGKTAFLPRKWHHLCLSYDGLSQTISGVLVS